MTIMGRKTEREDVGFDVREGDVLVVHYPEVTVPIAPYASVKVGGLIYTRQLVKGDDVALQYDRIYEFLKKRAERDANDKVRAWAAEMAKARESR